MEEKKTNFLCLVQQFILHNNIVKVEINGSWKILKQQSGSITGSNHAVHEANIYLSFSEHLSPFLPDFVELDVRFVDDRLLITVSTESEARGVIERVRKTYGDEISLTATLSKDFANYLDIHLTRSKSFNKLVDFCPYFKPQKKRISLDWESAHPRSMYTGVIKGESVRLLRLSSQRVSFENARQRFLNMLVKQGWDRKFVFCQNTVSWEERAVYLTRKRDREIPEGKEKENKRVFFPLTFSPDPALVKKRKELQDIIRGNCPEKTVIRFADRISNRLSTVLKRYLKIKRSE